MRNASELLNRRGAAVQIGTDVPSPARRGGVPKTFLLAGTVLAAAALAGGAVILDSKMRAGADRQATGTLTSTLAPVMPSNAAPAPAPAVAAPPAAAAPLQVAASPTLPGPALRSETPLKVASLDAPPLRLEEAKDIAPTAAQMAEIPKRPEPAPPAGQASAEPKSPPQPKSPPAAERPGPSQEQVTGYLARARDKVRQGDIVAARRLLELAAEGSHPDALFALAETYDPRVLAEWGVVGTKPDPAMARKFYEKAASRGANGTGARLFAMH